ncbi:MAG TPA: hypothetical protein EYH54_04705 [Nautiliaceae bacterium]|nr:hypothetical protein [Nautiliaceae bacterium]
MKKIIGLVAVTIFLFGYKAKVEPFEVYNIKAEVNGKVVMANKNLEAANVKNKLIIKIDDTDNKIDVENLQTQLALLKEQINNQEVVVQRKKEIYERYKKLKTRSQTEKDLKFFDYISSLNQLINLKSQYSNTLANLKKIKETIKKKSIKANGYLFKIYVKKDDYVNLGSLIAKVYDISKQKLTIYVPTEERENIKNKKVYVNGKKSNFTIYKIWNVTDDKFVTSYKIELVGSGLKFGEIVNIELK